MPEVSSWKDWLLWPLRSHFGARTENAADLTQPPPRDLGFDKWGRPWKYDESDFFEFGKIYKPDGSDDWHVQQRRTARGWPSDGFFIESDGIIFGGDRWDGLPCRKLGFRIEELSRHAIKPSLSWAAQDAITATDREAVLHEQSPNVVEFRPRRAGLG